MSRRADLYIALSMGESVMLEGTERALYRGVKAGCIAWGDVS